MTTPAARATTVRTVGLRNWRPLTELASVARTWSAAVPAFPLEGLAPPARARRVDLEPLWAAVFEAPDDAQRRLVLADALQEQGDARGEFISLQLARKSDERPSAREKELLAQLRDDWMGPLALSLRTPEYVGGLVVGGSVRGRIDDLPAALEVPAWGAVRRLDFPRPAVSIVRALLSNPRATHLETLTGLVARAVFDALEVGPPRTWAQLQLLWAQGETVTPLIALEAKLPRLRALMLTSHDVEHLQTLMGSALGARLTTLGFMAGRGFQSAAAQVKQAPRLERLIFDRDGLSAVLDLKARTLRVFIEWESTPLFECPRELSAITVVACGKSTAHAEFLAMRLREVAPVSLVKGTRPSMAELLLRQGPD